MKYHTFILRVWAGFVDSLVFLPLGIIDYYVSNFTSSKAIILFWTVFSYSCYWIYSVFYHSKYGQTLGKMMLRIRVLDVSEEHLPSLKQALIRDIGYIIPSFLIIIWLLYLELTNNYTGQKSPSDWLANLVGTLNLIWFLLEIITMTTNSKRRAFHDYIAKTVVVRY